MVRVFAHPCCPTQPTQRKEPAEMNHVSKPTPTFAQAICDLGHARALIDAPGISDAEAAKRSDAATRIVIRAASIPAINPPDLARKLILAHMDGAADGSPAGLALLDSAYADARRLLGL